jgi:riboflavin kinase / FMN adenylyltransferase
MEILQGLTGLRKLEPAARLSIGNFDGVHRGHQEILRLARECGGPGPRAVVTFEPHPLTVLRPALAPPRLTPLALKQELLEALGVDVLVVLPPSAEVLNLTAPEFWRILRDEVRPSHLIEGRSFTFGKGRAGTIQELRRWTAESSVRLHELGAVTAVLMDLHVVAVTSSLIRWLLGHGRVRDAAVCLGRAYALGGTVVRGHGRGRDMGVPTANLSCGEQLIPADGVYSGRCSVDGHTYAVAVSIGTLPTFGKNPRQVEAHLIGYEGDLYEQTLRLELVDWIRAQWKFDGPAPLKARMERDLAEVAQRQQDPARAIAVAEDPRQAGG